MQSIVLRDLDADPTSCVLFHCDASLAEQRFPAIGIEGSVTPIVRGLITRVSGIPCVLYQSGDGPMFRAGNFGCLIRPGVSSRFRAGLRKSSFELLIADEVAFRVAYARQRAGVKDLLLDLLDMRDDVLTDGTNAMDTFVNRPELLEAALTEKCK